MPTLREMRLELGWTVKKLSDESGVSRSVINNAEKSHPILANTAKDLADALSRAFGREIKSYEIEGLNIL